MENECPLDPYHFISLSIYLSIYLSIIQSTYLSTYLSIYNLYLGYLPTKETEALTLAYSMVYNMGIDKGQITAAIHYARTMDIR